MTTVRVAIAQAEVALARDESMTVDVTGHSARPYCFEFRPIHHPRPVA